MTHRPSGGGAVRLGPYWESIPWQPPATPFPNLLTFHDAPTVIEQKLFVMFLEHRMRTFQGTFHASPDYALWYGWSEMQRDLREINELADGMRRNHVSASAQPAINPQARKKGKAE